MNREHDPPDRRDEPRDRKMDFHFGDTDVKRKEGSRGKQRRRMKQKVITSLFKQGDQKFFSFKKLFRHVFT